MWSTSLNSVPCAPLMQALRRPWPCTHGLPNTLYQACSHAPTILPHGSAVSSSPEKRISNNDPSACPAEMVSKGRKMRFPDNCVSHTAHIVMAMPTFSREEIVHLGDLARIALTDEEITRLQGELNVIADSINKVQEVASDDVPPTANRFRWKPTCARTSPKPRSRRKRRSPVARRPRPACSWHRESWEARSNR